MEVSDDETVRIMAKEQEEIGRKYANRASLASLESIEERLIALKKEITEK